MRCWVEREKSRNDVKFDVESWAELEFLLYWVINTSPPRGRTISFPFIQYLRFHLLLDSTKVEGGEKQKNRKLLASFFLVLSSFSAPEQSLRMLRFSRKVLSVKKHFNGSSAKKTFVERKICLPEALSISNRSETWRKLEENETDEELAHWYDVTAAVRLSSRLILLRRCNLPFFCSQKFKSIELFVLHQQQQNTSTSKSW